MDRPLSVPVNRSLARIKRYLLTAVALMAVVLGVGALPVVFLYFWMPSNEPAGSQTNTVGVSQPERLSRHNKDQAVAFVEVNVVPMDREIILAGQTVVVKDGKIVEMGASDKVKAPAGVLRISREAYHRLFQVARREGMRVIGHAPRNLGVEPMLEERQDAVAHAEEYLDAYFFYKMDESIKSADQETQNRFLAEREKRIPQLAQATAKAGTWVVANLEAYRNIALQVEDLDAALKREGVKYIIPDIAPHWMPERNTYARRFKRDRAPRFRAQYRLLEKTVKGFRDAGVRLLAGTDALNPCVAPGFSLHDELRNLVAAGLTPYEALRTATINAAEFLGATSGVVAVGKRADLILVNGDPHRS